MTDGRGTGTRIASIDALKGLAILAVICQHGLTSPILHDSFSDIYLRQAVPVLFILMGYNAVGSERRKPSRSLAASYGPAYWRGRAERLLLPWGLAFLGAVAVGVAVDRLAIGELNVIGALPVPGPGNYFLTILLTFTLVWPAWTTAFRRWPAATVVVSIAVDAGFELAAHHVPSFAAGGYPYGYDAALPRYMAAIAVGMWLGLGGERSQRLVRAILALLPLSVAYVLMARDDPSHVSWLVPGFTLTTNLLAVPLSASICLLALRFWPTGGIPLTGWLERLGAASFEVFLVQIVWFAALPGRGSVRILGDLAACAVVGLALHTAVIAIVGRIRRTRPPARPLVTPAPSR